MARALLLSIFLLLGACIHEITADTTTISDYTTVIEDESTAGPTPEPTNSPGARVSCGDTSMTLFLDRALLENNGVASEVHYEDLSCTGYDYPVTNQVAITTSYDRCGTVQQETATHIEFANTVTYVKPDSENGSVITRDFRLLIPVKCKFNRNVLLGNQFKPKTGMVQFREEGVGNVNATLMRYADTTFTTVPADLTAEVYLGQALYFAANLYAVTDLTILLERCWATPDVYPMDARRFTFIDNGCAREHTVNFFNSFGPMKKGFSIDAFTFIGEFPEVYIHCDILLCDMSPTSRCAQGCLDNSSSRKKREASAPRGSSSQPHTLSNGPLSSQPHDINALNSDNQDLNSSWMSSPVMMMLIAAAAFFVAIVVMVTVRKIASRGSSGGGAQYKRLETEDVAA